VHPGPSPDAADLVGLIESEDVTLTTGVPTVWLNVLDYLDDHDADVSSLERIVVGGSAAPEAMMRRYEEEYDVTVDHAWGMTETMSIGSVSRPKSWMDDWDRDERFEKRRRQGLLSPGLEMRVVDDDGEEVAWDGETLGELHVRGPTVASEYFERPDANEVDFEDGWLKTGDIVSVDSDGYMAVADRTKDIIKSGGEWISSIRLENELMAHDDVVEAAVVAVDDERWGERPHAYVVDRDGASVAAETLLDALSEEFPRWWLPDEVTFVDGLPKTATGKLDKKRLREGR
jgi:fatty-acyl-CoA synthase